jgi:hypothetical protein
MTCRTARRRVIVLLALVLTNASTAAWGQYSNEPGHVAGTAGGACNSSAINYGWPDPNGNVLKCVSNVWTLVTQPAAAGGSNGQVQFNNSNALAGSANLFWNNTNSWLGIGTAAPQSMLHVYGGEVQIGSSGASCASNNAGALRYASSTLYYCNGSAWTPSNTGATASAAGSDTQIQFNQGGNFSADGNFNWDYTHHRLGIGTSAPSYDLSFGGAASREIWLERATSGAGNSLTVAAGGAQSGATDKAGGSLILSSGISTGTGWSNIQLQSYPAAASTNTTDNTLVTALKVFASGSASSGQGTLATTVKATDGGGTDKNGGTLNLSSGTSTGTGTSNINFKVYGAVGSSSSTPNAATTAMTILGNGNAGIGSSSPQAKLDVNGAIDIGGQNGITYPAAETNAPGASIAIGVSALANMPAYPAGHPWEVYGNVAIGYQSMSNSGMTTGAIWNTAVGYQTLQNITSGGGNTAIGFAALANNTSGNSNTMMGSTTGFYLDTGSNNTGIGNGALGWANSGASNNTAIGAGALQGQAWNQNMTGWQNTALGIQAGQNITGGSGNTVLGYQVAAGGGTLTTGYNNILIGTDNTTDTPAGNTSNFLNIGNAIYGTNLKNSNNSGGVASIGINTAAPQSMLHVYGGEVQIGSSGASCAGNNAGALRYASGVMYFCNGTNNTWTNPATGGTAAAAGSNNQIQYNEGNAMAASSALTWDPTNKWLGVGTTTPFYDAYIWDSTVPAGTSQASLPIAPPILTVGRALNNLYNTGGSINFEFSWNNGSGQYYTQSRIVSFDQANYGGNLAFFTNALG